MSSLLVIDTASAACSVALWRDGEMLAGEYREIGRGHAEQLVPMIARLPGGGRAARISVDVGPGSFTGVRIGLSAARALAFAWDAELAGYSALQLLARQVQRDRPDEPVTVANRAGHGELFVQNFGADGRALDRCVSLTPEAAAAAAATKSIVGSAAEELAKSVPGARAVDLLPDARAVYLLSPDDMTADPLPVYGRAPDAVPAASQTMKDKRNDAAPAS